MDLTEKVARAIYEANPLRTTYGDFENERYFSEVCTKFARAAIAVCAEDMAKVAEQAGGARVGAADSSSTRTIGTALDAAAAVRKIGGQ